MPPKSPSSKSKPAAKNDKTAPRKPRMTWAQIFFVTIGLIMVVTMVLALLKP
ncbi:MAG: hypothetical protein WA821_00425 [Anaerolineales bacterium]